MTLPHRLAGMMRRRGVRSQSQLARISGVSQSSVQRILCRDGHSPTLDTLTKIAKALDTSVSWLAYGTAEYIVLPTPHPMAANPRSGDSATDQEQVQAMALVLRLPRTRQRSVWRSMRQLAEAASHEEGLAALAAQSSQPKHP